MQNKKEQQNKEKEGIIKRFLEWIGLKEKLHTARHEPPFFKEGEIWWCAVGENMGIEINGKGGMFSRPVYVYKKLSREGFLGIPLSTSKREGTWYVEIIFKEKTSVLNLAQARVCSASRMYEKMGAVEDKDSEKIKNGFLRLYS
jgi:mRNA interferase MazF